MAAARATGEPALDSLPAAAASAAGGGDGGESSPAAALQQAEAHSEEGIHDPLDDDLEVSTGISGSCALILTSAFSTFRHVLSFRYPLIPSLKHMHD